ERPNIGTSEQRAAQPGQSQQQLFRTAAAQLLTMPVSSVLTRSIPLDTVSVAPLLGTESTLQQGARVVLGQRISERVYLTYSRTLSQQAQLDLILLEYEQSDRVSWILSRNEDRTFALDFRIRHVF